MSMTVGDAIKMMAERLGRLTDRLARIEQDAEERALAKILNADTLADRVPHETLDYACQLAYARRHGQIEPLPPVPARPLRHRQRESEDDTGVFDRIHRSTGARRGLDEIVGAAVVFGAKKAFPHILTSGFFVTLYHLFTTYWPKK